LKVVQFPSSAILRMKGERRKEKGERRKKKGGGKKEAKVVFSYAPLNQWRSWWRNWCPCKD